VGTATLKRCSHCREPKPTSEFRRDRSRPDGLYPQCLDCSHRADRGRRVREAERKGRPIADRAEWGKPEAPCVQCRRRPRAKGRLRCPRCAWKRRDPDKLRANMARWSARNRARLTEASRRYRAEIADRERARLWDAVSNANQRARRRGIAGRVTIDGLAARWAYFGGKCWRCRADATQFDHVLPLGESGPNLAANIRPACDDCNRGKGRPRAR